MKTTLAMAAGVLLVEAACSGHDVTFEHLRTATRIEVTTIANERIATISAKEKIASVLSFLESHRTGWSERLSRGSVPRLAFNFFNDGRLLGSVGLGPDYLTDGPSRSFASTAVDPSEVTRLLALLDVALPSEGSRGR